MTSFFFYRYGDHRDLHVLTHSFPTRRSSDLSPHSRMWHLVGGAADRWRLGGVRPRQSPQSAQSRLDPDLARRRSEEHTSELQSLMRISYAVFCLKKKTNRTQQ